MTARGVSPKRTCMVHACVSLCCCCVPIMAVIYQLSLCCLNVAVVYSRTLRMRAVTTYFEQSLCCVVGVQSNIQQSCDNAHSSQQTIKVDTLLLSLAHKDYGSRLTSLLQRQSYHGWRAWVIRARVLQARDWQGRVVRARVLQGRVVQGRDWQGRQYTLPLK